MFGFVRWNRLIIIKRWLLDCVNGFSLDSILSFSFQRVVDQENVKDRFIVRHRLFEVSMIVHCFLHRISFSNGCCSSPSNWEIRQSMSLMQMNNQFESFSSEETPSQMNRRTASFLQIPCQRCSLFLRNRSSVVCVDIGLRGIERIRWVTTTTTNTRTGKRNSSPDQNRFSRHYFSKIQFAMTHSESEFVVRTGRNKSKIRSRRSRTNSTYRNL